MSRNVIKPDIKKDREDLRAKQTKITINGKTANYPLKSAGVSVPNQYEYKIAREEVDRTVVNEFAVQINPKRLREIVTNEAAHQSLKNDIRTALGDIEDHAINVVYPLLRNLRSPNEPIDTFKPFPQPTTRIAEKLFDLFDIESIDMIVSPVAIDDRYEVNWANVCAPVFATRKADFLNEYALSGLIPQGISGESSKTMADIYLANGFESLTFDFFGNRLRESKMKDIILSLQNWDSLLVHGVNVPHFNWHGTHASPVQATYDVLVDVYGFDSFGNMRYGFDSPPLPSEKISKKISNKRFHHMETYGAYNKDGLKAALETMSFKCQCPICRTKASPLDLFNREVTNEDLDALNDDLKMHRQHATHKEMAKLAGLMKKGKYHEYLIEKKAAAKEIQSILAVVEKTPNPASGDVDKRTEAKK